MRTAPEDETEMEVGTAPLPVGGYPGTNPHLGSLAAEEESRRECAHSIEVAHSTAGLRGLEQRHQMNADYCAPRAVEKLAKQERSERSVTAERVECSSYRSEQRQVSRFR